MDNQSTSKFKSIPASACLLAVGDFEVGDNGANAKTAPIKLVARSGKPIEHWFWGRIVHDLSGMVLLKKKVAIDYCHDDKEVIGYLNQFDISTGDLVTSGALVPWKYSDRATEIIHKGNNGVPYEASINFGGDGILVEEVQEGMSAPVNGYMFEGPGVIVRQWPLRGVAICPYGADQNTEMTSFKDANKTFSATVASATVPQVETPTEEKTEMSQSVEVVAAVTVTEATEQEEVKPMDEVKPAEEQATEGAPVEVPTVEAEMPIEKKPTVCSELAEVKSEVEELKLKNEQAEKELSEKSEIAKLKAEKEALLAELSEKNRKLSAFQNGETVLSSTAQTSKNSASPWADAQKRK